MIKVENIEVFNFEGAVRGMRNPLNSWAKSDSEYEPANFCDVTYRIGPNDLDLMRRLYKAGPEHRKYLRQIFVSMDITAPLYLWKEIDQYKVGTVTNSCSTMHKLTAKPFEMDDFSTDHILNPSTAREVMYKIIETLNQLRAVYLEGNLAFEKHDKQIWYEMIQLLPSSYNQRRTITMNYENVISMIKQRSGHKLDEWNEFVEILKGLPYIEEITRES